MCPRWSAVADVGRLNHAYLWLRRRVRDAVIHNPAVDNTVGNLFRMLEKRIVGLRAVQRRAEATGGSLRVRGVTLTYRPQDLGVVAPLLMHEDYEPETREVIEGALGPGMTFVDLGAHIGFLTLLAAKQVGPDGCVYAFEPIAATADLLAANVAANGLGDVVTSVRLAVSDEPKDLVFAISREHSVSNKMARAVVTAEETMTLRATSLDAYFEELGWPSVDLIKMDVEGAELDAMRGMRELSARNARMKLIFEFHYANLEQMNISASQLFDELAKLGFTRFTRLHRQPKPIIIPDDIEETLAMSRVANFNVLAEKS